MQIAKKRVISRGMINAHKDFPVDDPLAKFEEEPEETNDFEMEMVEMKEPEVIDETQIDPKFFRGFEKGE